MNEQTLQKRQADKEHVIWEAEEMVQRTRAHVNRILRENLYEMKLNERQLNRLARQKSELRDCLARCGVGDETAKRILLSRFC